MEKIKFNKVFIIIFLLLFASGFQQTVEGLKLEGAHPSVYLIMMAATIALMLYVVPFLFGTKFLIKKLDTHWCVFLLTLAGGAFIATMLSSHGNELLDVFWPTVLPKAFAEKWADALSGPFTEEIIKGLVAVITLKAINKKKAKDYLMAGLGVGMGFQIAEDIYYIFPKDVSGKAVTQIFPQLMDRFSGSLSSHWAYSAIFVVGIFMVIKYRKNIWGYIYIFGTILLHFLWNSPIGELDGSIPVFTPILTTLTLLLLAKVIKDVFKENKVEVELETI